MSGDLAEQAKKSEFEDALQFLISLSDRLQVPRRHVVIVPGNHDINRKLCEAYFNECEGNDQPPAPPYSRKWQHYHWLFQEFYKGEKGISFTIEEPWTFWELEDLKLVVAGLNSTMAESHQDGTHYGQVGEAQLRWFADRLAPFRERGWFRLGVVHHNIERGATNDDENLRDTPDLKRILAPSLNLLLHGHTHDSAISWLMGPTRPTLSTGSAALNAEARPAEVPNQYQAIRIWPDRIERWMRRYDPGKKQWTGDSNGSEDKVQFQSAHAIFPGAAPPPPIEPPTRPDRERPDPRDDFLSRVAAVCRLRYRNSEVDVRSGYLRVTAADGPTVRVFPVGVCEFGMSEDELERQRRDVFAQYRALDPNLPCEIVYSGPHAPDDLIRKAAASGVRLSSFVEFQGIIDFSGYVDRQTRKLESDLIYPPKLYVPQRQVYEIGRDRHEAPDACAAILDWLTEPLARFVLVLGDFGAGKSFLLHEVARRMPEQIPHLTPVFVELRALEKANTLEQLIAQHLAAAGERYIDLAAFPYMLREGRIALLFDGFDELAQRVTYERATEHFETLLQSAAGRAKVVVTSRTQHFESDKQVKTALLERTETLSGLHLVRLQPFDEPQIVQFLQNLPNSNSTKAASRFELIKDIRDLLGLSHNPRMLSFIAGLPEDQLCEAQAKSGKITSAELYRLLIDRWLTYEYERTQPRGAAPTLTVQERWDAVTAVALCLWPKLERTIRLTELTAEVAHALDKLTEKQLDHHIATHLIGSGTLLVRDDAGTFAFVHQSVMEWLVANHAAEQIRSGAAAEVLAVREMSLLMADFLCDLAGHEKALDWARATLDASAAKPALAVANAVSVTGRLSRVVWAVNLAGQNLRGKDFSLQNLTGANFAGADLTEARFEQAGLKGADFTGAILERADFTRASLVGCKLDGVQAAGARFLGADFRQSTLTKANLRRTKLVGARFSPSALADCDLFGAALPDAVSLAPMISSSSPSNCIAFGLEHLLASAHKDGTIHLWEASNGKELRALRGHESAVLSVAFSPDGQWLASASDDKTLRLWEVASGRELRALRGHESSVSSVAFSPDGQRLASASDDKTVRLWESASGKELRCLRGHESAVNCVAFSPDGERLASASDDHTVRLWEAASGKELRCLRGHESYVNSVVFSLDGQRLASASFENTVRLWEAASGKELRALRHESSVNSVAFSPDGQRLASASSDNTVRLWEGGRELRVLRGHESPVRSVAFSPDGQRLASASADKTVRLWEASSGKELRALRGRESYISSVAFSPDGQRLATANKDQTIRLWEAASGKELCALRGHESFVLSVAFSPDGQRLASASNDNTVRLWDASSGKELRALRGHQSPVNSVVFSPDGQWLASASEDNTVRLWEGASGKELRALRHEFSVRTVAFSSDGHRLASASHDRTVCVWEATGKELRALSRVLRHASSVNSVTFSPDGGRLASASADTTVRLWDASTGKELYTLRGHQSSVRSAAFSPDGLRLASASNDNTVRLWEATTGKELRILRGHESGVTSVAFNPGGQQLASASDDGTIRLWNPNTGTLLATLLSTPEGWAAFTPTGRYKISGNLGGAFWYAVGLCRFEPGELDPYLPPGTLRQLALDEPLIDPAG